VRKDWPELVSIMNKAIADFTPLERKAINDRWIAVDIRQDRWWVVAFRVATGIAIAAVLIFLLLFLYNRRLASELAERRRMQLELEKAHQELARASEEKSELLRMVAHDLRSPLTGVLLGTDLLKMMDPQAERKVFENTLAQIRTTTAQMIRLTNDLVDVNVLEEGKRPYVAVDVDVVNLLHETVSAFSEAAARKHIRLALQVEEPVPGIRSDAMALRQVCDNLISNSLKYSPEHTDVTVVLRRSDSGVRLLVRDQGPGISMEERHNLFQKFVQGSAKPTGGEKSTGLGLWIVQRVVSGLHGRVWCESEVGKGATFIVELPLAPPRAA
jgi:signal transduction histidine kinase